MTDYYVAAYFYDFQRKYEEDNPSLMWQNPGKRNWTWSIDKGYHDWFPSYTELIGQLLDSFFVETELTRAELEERCRKSIFEKHQDKPSYKLFDYSAATSALNPYEYPIHFKKDESNQTIKKMVIFGDSLSDTGNLKHWVKLMPEYPYWYGRFTNGLTWSEYLSKETGITLFNWAYGGAKSDLINDFKPKEILDYVKSGGRNVITGSMTTTINRYLDNGWLSGKKIDLTAAEETAYTLWIGANDYLEKFDSEETLFNLIEYPNDIGGYEKVSDRATDNIIENIKKINDKGAKYFIIPNLPNVGKTPTIATVSYDFSRGSVKTREDFSAAITNIINVHNNKLKIKIESLKEERGKYLEIVYIDLFSDFDALLENKNPFTGDYFDAQFENEYYDIQSTGSSAIQIPKQCFQGGYTAEGITNSDWRAYASNNTSKTKDGSFNFLSTFWDNVHPTSYAHSLIAYSFQYWMKEAGLISSSLPKLEDYRDRNRHLD
ncbi:SGNH/GDSL hydrolase family protein [Moorena sp. SIO4G3]|uniref:SGNH/GDSL hydrolase family protein n=1 Tax=Moorena sp. SIO4G3 TaxID=2607821 RepID=UPI00142B7A78|nr:SGNH/GDSL hydrolase family protein [Moorena sp. SIO4G3]NEO77120.1 SGNH/GDSL hydrolase family protein [Moorena sp. SIO4G3]